MSEEFKVKRVSGSEVTRSFMFCFTTLLSWARIKKGMSSVDTVNKNITDELSHESYVLSLRYINTNNIKKVSQHECVETSLFISSTINEKKKIFIKKIFFTFLISVPCLQQIKFEKLFQRFNNISNIQPDIHNDL